MELLRIILVVVISVVSDGLIVHGPSLPLVVPLGSSLVLPCYVDKPILIQDLVVEWRRTEFNVTIHRYQYGKTQPEAQHPFYNERANFFTEEIKNGNFSLRLDYVRGEDEGEYACKVQSQQDFGETVVHIKVERLLVPGSYESIFASVGEDVTLNCSLNSYVQPEGIEEVSWRKLSERDIMVLLYRNNEISLNSSDEQYRHRAELFTEEIPKGNLSLKLKSARVEDRGFYTCQVLVGGISDQTFVFLERVSDAEYCKNIYYAAAKRKKLLEDLGLDKNDFQISRIWPLVFIYKPVQIQVDLYVSSIIEVNEKAQSLTTQVIMITAWPNYYLQWNQWDYCEINSSVAPKTSLWTPDIIIKESINTDYGTKESQYVKLFSYGAAALTDILSLTTACKMDLYRFPFDTQRCNITLQSTVYSVEEIEINPITGSAYINTESNGLFQAQGEWELLDIETTKDQMYRWFTMDQLIYKITIKRRPLLYVINIIVPVFLFLVLDVISFLIDASGQDKLNFKVTLLLTISVFLLILNDTLPSTADKLPLIGIYCCGIFLLIGISLMETIIVNFLRGKKVKRRSAKAPVSGQDVKDVQSPPESVIGQTEETSNECPAAAQPKQQKKTCVSWTRVARIIDVIFFILYIIAIIAFLTIIGKLWFPHDDLYNGNGTQY